MPSLWDIMVLRFRDLGRFYRINQLVFIGSSLLGRTGMSIKHIHIQMTDRSASKEKVTKVITLHQERKLPN